MVQRSWIDDYKKVSEAVKLASRATILVRGEGEIEKMIKQDDSPVTIADLASQAILLRTIANSFPEDKIFAEEEVKTLANPGVTEKVQDVVEQIIGSSVSAGELRDYVGHKGASESSTGWFIDPLDGTKGFVKGLVYAIAAARVENGDITHSWLGVPGHDELLGGVCGKMYHAVQNGGAYTADLTEGSPEEKIEPAVVDLKPVLKVVGSRAHGGKNLPPPLVEAGINAENVGLDSQAKYAVLAMGKAHIYPRLPSKSFGRFFCWDHAPGALLVQEVGGVVTDLTGKELDWTQGDRMYNNLGIFAAVNREAYDSYFKYLQIDEGDGEGSVTTETLKK